MDCKNLFYFYPPEWVGCRGVVKATAFRISYTVTVSFIHDSQQFPKHRSSETFHTYRIELRLESRYPSFQSL